jgi:hypothetical protein
LGEGALFILNFSVWFWLKLAKMQCYDLIYLNQIIWIVLLHDICKVGNHLVFKWFYANKTEQWLVAILYALWYKSVQYQPTFPLPYQEYWDLADLYCLLWFWLKLAKMQCYDLNYLNQIIWIVLLTFVRWEITWSLYNGIVVGLPWTSLKNKWYLL